MSRKKPIILSVDDDPNVLQSIKGDLRNRYRKDYRIISAISANEALETLPELKNRGEEIALFLSDQRMPEMNGVDFLKKAKEIFPCAKRALLTAYSETDTAINAINEVQLDYYLTKPWDPPEEKLYPIIDELLEEYQANREISFQGIKLLSYPNNPKTHALKEFLSGNLVPYRYIDPNNLSLSKSYIEVNDLKTEDYPTVILENGKVLKQVSITNLATEIGLSTESKYDLYDVIIIGAGPGGLAAGVYGGSEGLKTAIIEKLAPGGQAGTSSRIENYLGFPNGVSGAELSRRAYAQVLKFGVDFISPTEVEELSFEGDYKKLTLKNGNTLISKSIILASGMTYRKHIAKGIEKFTGISIYYGAATTEAKNCTGKNVVVVGGGNSAGQGAVYLSNYAKKVTIMIRRPDLSSSMSQYLIDQIEAIDNIEIRGYTEILEAKGDAVLESLELLNNQTKNQYEEPTEAMFVFIGTRPNTDWFKHQLLRDQKGFVLTGRDVVQAKEFNKIWSESREPMSLETCVPGIFAVGDVRSGAMNRVAAAVGEGSMSIKMTHEYLSSL